VKIDTSSKENMVEAVLLQLKNRYDEEENNILSADPFTSPGYKLDEEEY
jgi:hypothetical protein